MHMGCAAPSKQCVEHAQQARICAHLLRQLQCGVQVCVCLMEQQPYKNKLLLLLRGRTEMLSCSIRFKYMRKGCQHP